MKSMKLYSNTRSRSNTILPLLKELDIEQQIEIVEVPYEEMHQPAYLKIRWCFKKYADIK
ncbi:hypothetical protein [Acinetobacter sp. YH12158]|uniref:hypothetical protein n=1 Tax=unclassified Acinetobacter TaxID=196816 RepID=UPI00359FD3AC